MVDGTLLEAALELINHAFGSEPDNPAPAPTDGAPVNELSPRERALATAILARRHVSVAAAEELVRWLRTQDARFSV